MRSRALVRLRLRGAFVSLPRRLGGSNKSGTGATEGEAGPACRSSSSFLYRAQSGMPRALGRLLPNSGSAAHHPQAILVPDAPSPGGSGRCLHP